MREKVGQFINFCTVVQGLYNKNQGCPIVMCHRVFLLYIVLELHTASCLLAAKIKRTNRQELPSAVAVK